jgi:hypothetical protein
MCLDYDLIRSRMRFGGMGFGSCCWIRHEATLPQIAVYRCLPTNPKLLVYEAPPVLLTLTEISNIVGQNALLHGIRTRPSRLLTLASSYYHQLRSRPYFAREIRVDNFPTESSLAYHQCRLSKKNQLIQFFNLHIQTRLAMY